MIIKSSVDESDGHLNSLFSKYLSFITDYLTVVINSLNNLVPVNQLFFYRAETSLPINLRILQYSFLSSLLFIILNSLSSFAYSIAHA